MSQPTIVRLCALALLAVVAVIAVILRPSHLASAPLVTGTWRMYQGTPDHNAVISEPGLRAHWTATTDGRINGAMALLDGTLFVGSMDGNAYAFDARTGALRWQQALGRPTMSGAIVADGLVIFGTGNNDLLVDTFDRVIWGSKKGDAVVALDAMNGSPMWRFATVGEDMPTAAVVRRDGKDLLVVSNGDDHVYGLDLATGALEWKHQTAGISSMSSLATDGNVVYGLTNLSQAYADQTARDEARYRLRSRSWALDLATRRMLFDVPFGNSDCSPTLGGGKLFIEGDHRLHPEGSPRGDARNILGALDPRTGRVLWRYVSRPGAWSGMGSNEEAIAGLYAGDTYYASLPYPRQFAAFDPKNGRIRWLIETGSPVKMSAVLAGGTLFFGDTAGTLYAVDARTGRILHRRSLRGTFGAAPPLVAGDTLFLASGKRVVALPLEAARARAVTLR